MQATDNPLKDVNVTRPDEIAPCLTQEQALARRRRPSTAASPSRRSWGTPSERTHPLRRRHAGRPSRRQGAVVTELTQACLDQIAATDDRYHAFLHVGADQALSAAAPLTRRWPPARRCRRRWPACRWRSRTSSPRLTCPPPAARRFCRTGDPPTTPR
ncbi:glutamyl-tRNA(Gln) amidotransferase subunit A domain protein [Mycobacterium kansasii 662]|uniref:Glutamyl-tRNA(Gln) amidotransferase subunit A domain protein n=1 Tax=Mycobacterium kansasii 662 TaxID=1299326 RepID=X7XTG4_MYCKA|nr:glutamyl-tRNA(Gln) amidotransferase subunit A domain protein [Mycobacterium kansasii 662]